MQGFFLLRSDLHSEAVGDSRENCFGPNSHCDTLLEMNGMTLELHTYYPLRTFKTETLEFLLELEKPKQKNYAM